MNERTLSSSPSVIGFTGLLTVLFIGLKLTGYVNWSWWWVLAPTWIPMLIVIIIMLFVIAFRWDDL